MRRRTMLALLLAACSPAPPRRAAQRPGARSAPEGPAPTPTPEPLDPPTAGPGNLPPPEDAIAALLADDLGLTAARAVNPAVWRLDFTRPDGTTVRAKWKAMGLRGSEVQDGYDGNDAPRTEIAASRLDRFLFAGDVAHSLVPPVVLRAFHRDVPCDGACRNLPRVPDELGRPTFPEHNDHLVIGALTTWLDGVERPERFHGELWDPARFASDPAYARSVSDLFVFLVLVAHGDANYADNYLVRASDRARFYSIDHGRSLDGIPYYTSEADPDWAALAPPRVDALIAPRFSRATRDALARLDRERVARMLRCVAEVDLASGAPVAEPFVDAPLVSSPGVRRLGRGTFLRRVDGRVRVALGIGEAGIGELAVRAAALVARIDSLGYLEE